MHDEKLAERAKNFRTTTYKNIQKYREGRTLSLRKDKLFETIMEKRLSHQNNTDDISTTTYTSENIPSSYHGISYTNINISDDHSLYYSSLKELNKIQILKEWVKEDDYDSETSLKRFALFNLRKNFNNLGNNSLIKKELLDEELIRCLRNDIVKLKDHRAVYEISFIFTRLTYLFSKMSEIFFDSDFLQEMIQFTYSGHIPLTENILIIFGNLLLDDRKFITEKTCYINRIRELIINEDFLSLKEHNNNTNIPIILLWNFNNLFGDFAENEISLFVDLIPYFMNFMNKKNLYLIKTYDKNQDELFQLLKIFQIFSNFESIIEILLKNDLVPDLIYLLQYINLPYKKDFAYDKLDILNLSTDHLLLILKIINNIYSAKNEVLEYISDQFDKILEIFENLLYRYRFYQSDDKKIVCEILWTLSNMSALYQNYIEKISFSKVPYYLLTFFFKEEEIMIIDLEIFENILQNGSDKSTVEILKLNFLEFLCKAFREINKPNALRSCLDCIKCVVIFTKNIYSGHEGSNIPNASKIIKIEMEKHGLTTRLEQLCLHNNKEISQYSTNLLNVVENLIFSIE